MHGSGHQYEWEQDLSIFDYDPEPCEPWMIDYLKTAATRPSNRKTPSQKTSLKPSENRNTVSKPAPHTSYADILAKGAVQGLRNHTAAKLIGHLLGKGNDPAVVWQTVKQWNSGKNKPPLDESELKTTFESIRDLHAKNKPTKQEAEEIDIEQFLDSKKKVTAEHNEQYLRVSFAGTLLTAMESKMNGGLIGGRTYVLGGIPSSGKTVLANNIADNICLNGHPVLFFSYDDGATELRYRTFSRFSGFDIENFNRQRHLTSDLEAILANPQISAISQLKYVVQKTIKVEDWPQLVEKIRTHHQKAPVIIVDYLRKVRSKSSKSDERLRVDEILSSLTTMAKTYNVPVLVISELARDSYKTGQRLSMASFKESGSIEYEASWLGILAAVEDDGYTLKRDWEHIINQDGNIDLIVFKTKRGTGQTGRVSLKLDKVKMTVRDRGDSVKAHSVTPITKKSKFA